MRLITQRVRSTHTWDKTAEGYASVLTEALATPGPSVAAVPELDAAERLQKYPSERATGPGPKAEPIANTRRPLHSRRVNRVTGCRSKGLPCSRRTYPSCLRTGRRLG